MSLASAHAAAVADPMLCLVPIELAPAIKTSYGLHLSFIQGKVPQSAVLCHVLRIGGAGHYHNVPLEQPAQHHLG